MVAHTAWLPPRRWCEASGLQEEGWGLPLERSHQGADQHGTGRWENDNFLWVWDSLPSWLWLGKGIVVPLHLRDRSGSRGLRTDSLLGSEGRITRCPCFSWSPRPAVALAAN